MFLTSLTVHVNVSTIGINFVWSHEGLVSLNEFVVRKIHNGNNFWEETCTTNLMILWLSLGIAPWFLVRLLSNLYKFKSLGCINLFCSCLTGCCSLTYSLFPFIYSIKSLGTLGVLNFRINPKWNLLTRYSSMKVVVD